MRYRDKWPEYAKQWDAMVIKPSRRAEFVKLAEFALDNRKRYQAIANVTGVHWMLIAVLHRRESDADFNTYLGNGEPLNRKTREVPEGRGPFTGPNAFVDGAIDAVKLDGLSDVRDWRIEKMLYYCELFNGAGYHNGPFDKQTQTKYPPMPSPYVWGGTNIQKPGKYVRDHVFRTTDKDGKQLWDSQPGCAPILATIAEIYNVPFVRED